MGISQWESIEVTQYDEDTIHDEVGYTYVGGYTIMRSLIEDTYRS